MKAQCSKTLALAQSINERGVYYGTFAEIGAGQEVARYFFQAGLASSTIAKTMSAYDKNFSDAIYGKVGRFVSRERLECMLSHEYELLEQRLGHLKEKKAFFVYANTVAVRPSRRSSGAELSAEGPSHCWCGLRFQPQIGAPSVDVVLHLKMLDPTRLEQHEALGVLGVNLLYAAFMSKQHEKEAAFEAALMRDLAPGRVNILKD